MERLPDDILLLILQKVASQAPPVSLHRMSCVCRALHRVVSQNPALWEHAFYWPGQRPNTPVAGALKDVVEGQLGGFKGFVTARLRLLTKRNMQPSLQEIPTEPTCPTSCSEVVLLFIVRSAAGKVTMWGVAPLENRRLLSEDQPGNVLDQTLRLRVPLQQIDTADFESYQDVLRAWGVQSFEPGLCCWFSGGICFYEGHLKSSSSARAAQP